MKSTTEQVLKQYHRNVGLYVEEDDHNVLLKDQFGIIIAPFSIHTTREVIQAIADAYCAGGGLCRQ